MGFEQTSLLPGHFQPLADWVPRSWVAYVTTPTHYHIPTHATTWYDTSQLVMCFLPLPQLDPSSTSSPHYWLLVVSDVDALTHTLLLLLLSAEYLASHIDKLSRLA
jgi:hypothetical protein